MKKQNWKKYAYEFVSIFVAVVSAFALNNWNDNRRDRIAESKILTEIQHGLEKDRQDVQLNVMGHEFGIRACAFFRNLINEEEQSLDTLVAYYFEFTRDFVAIQNASGYETLKSKGFELLKNDSLRTKIISLYEYDYQLLRKLEEDHGELQFFDNYFHEINRLISPHLEFDVNGQISGIDLPLDLNESDKKLLLSYLWKIQQNRRFMLWYYEQVEEKIDELEKEISSELGHH
ncbi:MAG: hypothetical protein AAF391_07655 [Bacteroidota bacterium]